VALAAEVHLVDQRFRSGVPLLPVRQRKLWRCPNMAREGRASTARRCGWRGTSSGTTTLAMSVTLVGFSLSFRS
jgi:hypothetical protein